MDKILKQRERQEWIERKNSDKDWNREKKIGTQKKERQEPRERGERKTESSKEIFIKKIERVCDGRNFGERAFVCTLEMADQGFQFIFGRLCEEINKRKKK